MNNTLTDKEIKVVNFIRTNQKEKFIDFVNNILTNNSDSLVDDFYCKGGSLFRALNINSIEKFENICVNFKNNIGIKIISSLLIINISPRITNYSSTTHKIIESIMGMSVCPHFNLWII